MANIELFSARVCPFAQRCRMMLIEKGLTFEEVEIDLGNKPDWFRQLSPYGKVPLLRHGEIRIFETAIINEYLEETFPDPPLMPVPPALRAHVRIWIDYCNTQFIPTFYRLLLSQDRDEQHHLRKRLLGHLECIEHEGLVHTGSKGPYWLGEKFGLLDVAWYPFFERLVVAEYYRQLHIPTACRHLLGWLEAMAERDSVRMTANSSGYYLRHYAKYADGSANGITAREMRPD